MADCPWWAWVAIAGLGVCLLVVGLYAGMELVLWVRGLRRGGWGP
jgi:hypothetical protein